MDYNTALAAYRSALDKVSSVSDSVAAKAKPQTASDSPAGMTFSEMLKNSMEKAVDLGKKSEEMSLKGVAGEADMQDVVLAVSNAEMALEQVVAVRDKVITAYQEIIRMTV